MPDNQSIALFLSIQIVKICTSINDAPEQKIQILTSLAGVGRVAWQVKLLHSSEREQTYLRFTFLYLD